MFWNKERIKTEKRKGFKKFLLVFVLIFALSGSVITIPQKQAEATFCIPCWACGFTDCFFFALGVEALQEFVFTPLIEQLIEYHMNYEERWIVSVFFEELWVKALAEMTNYLSAFAMDQVYMVGTFFDAKAQLETRRLFYKLKAEAHKDYYPSDDFCWFGTNVRSLAASEQRARLNHVALSQRSLRRRLGFADLASAELNIKEKEARWNQFVDTYCDPKDNGWNTVGGGLDLACDRDGPGGSALAGATQPYRMNRDIDFTRLVDEPRTLDVNFQVLSAAAPPAPPLPKEDDEDVLAMANNLYGHKSLTRQMSRQALAKDTGKKLYLSLRSVAARRGVAENSFDAIIGMKSKGTNGLAPGVADTGRFMASVIRELMVPVTNPPDTVAAVAQFEQEVLNVLGENPSYYAQLEFLAKKIYQNPEFFANLYDTPANVDRKSVAMKAIELMLDRALYESEIRQEMLLSVLLSNELRNEFNAINTDIAGSGG
ncbi:MAG: hypothetical protein OEY94_03875 [Alphaproteobacteria bacterium]|nr:hypothetical protein [Alphaproteobacteria bacterium]